MEDTTAVGPVLIEELKRQARSEGYLVLALSPGEVILYGMYLLGVLLGYSLARS